MDTADPASPVDCPISQLREGTLLTLEPLGLPFPVRVLIYGLLAAVTADPSPLFPCSLHIPPASPHDHLHKHRVLPDQGIDDSSPYPEIPVTELPRGSDLPQDLQRPHRRGIGEEAAVLHVRVEVEEEGEPEAAVKRLRQSPAEFPEEVPVNRYFFPSFVTDEGVPSVRSSARVIRTSTIPRLILPFSRLIHRERTDSSVIP